MSGAHHVHRVEWVADRIHIRRMEALEDLQHTGTHAYQVVMEWQQRGAQDMKMTLETGTS